MDKEMELKQESPASGVFHWFVAGERTQKQCQCISDIAPIHPCPRLEKKCLWAELVPLLGVFPQGASVCNQLPLSDFRLVSCQIFCFRWTHRTCSCKGLKRQWYTRYSRVLHFQRADEAPFLCFSVLSIHRLECRWQMDTHGELRSGAPGGSSDCHRNTTISTISVQAWGSLPERDPNWNGPFGESRKWIMMTFTETAIWGLHFRYSKLKSGHLRPYLFWEFQDTIIQLIPARVFPKETYLCCLSRCTSMIFRHT